MKKHILMMVAVCLMALPAMANDLVEKLCADETFIAMAKECEKVSTHMLSLDDKQRAAYIRSAEFACFRENFTVQKEYLSVTFNLFERADSETVIRKALKKVVLQKDARWCLTMYNMYWMSCFSITDPYEQGSCFAWAQAWYTQCMIEVGGVE